MTTSANNQDLIAEERYKKLKIWPLAEEAKELYFSDLSEEQLMTLFCKSPRFRFELMSVYVKLKRFSEQPKMYGFIQAAERPHSLSHYVFNHVSNDPVVVPDSSLFLDEICCSIPSSNYIQINAKLYVKTTTEKEEEKDKLVTTETTDGEKDKVVTTEMEVKEDGPPFHENEVVKLLNYYSFKADGSMTLKSKDVVENDDRYDMQVYKELETFNFTIPPENIKKPIELIENEPFEVCDGNLVINLSDGCAGCHILKGNGGALHVHYVALKYAVDAVIELEFVVPSNETKLSGYINAFYGSNFHYGCRHDKKNLYKTRLFHIKHDVCVKSGKLNLIRSVLAVPAQFSLIIDVHIRDTNGEHILKGPTEFFVPLNGTSSYGSIMGNDLSLKMKVDWKLPSDF